MKESHGKGLASRPDPESCVRSRKAEREALTGAHAGRVLSSLMSQSRVPTQLKYAEGHIYESDNASARRTLRSPRPLARMETPRAGTGRPHQRPTRSRERAGWRRP